MGELIPKNNNTKYDYIIYHKNCPDGFTGFYLFIKTKQWTSKPVVYPDMPHAKYHPPDIKGKNVIIIDVAYKPEIVKEISKKANKILFIDHHVSIKNDIDSLKLEKPHEVVYDVNRSGASLVWEYFYGNRELMPTFVKYIEDNDIGKWEYDETLPFMTTLSVKFNMEPTFDNLKKWDKLLDDDFINKMVENGKIYNEYKQYLIDENSKKYSIMKFPSKKISKKYKIKGKYKVAVINCGCPSVSLVGKQIVETVDCDFAIIWNYKVKDERYIVSLRSNKTDISKIAKALGGGGHKYAGAFSFSSNDFTLDEMFIKN